MKTPVLGFTLSLLLHAGLAGLFLALGHLVAVPDQPSRIDFRLSPAPAGNPGPALLSPAQPGLPPRMASMKVAPPLSLPPPPPPRRPEAAAARVHPAEIMTVRRQDLPVPGPEAPAASQAVAEADGGGAAEPQETPALPPLVAAAPPGNGDEEADGGSRQAGFQARYLREHYEYIKNDIQRQLVYPLVARKKGWQGRVVVSFVVCENGQVVDIRVVQSSGITLLDNSAVQTVRRAGPFVPPPHRAELVVPVNYLLG